MGGTAIGHGNTDKVIIDDPMRVWAGADGISLTPSESSMRASDCSQNAMAHIEVCDHPNLGYTLYDSGHLLECKYCKTYYDFGEHE